jgi:hypothetical protein
MRIKIVLAAVIGLWAAGWLSVASAQEAIEADASKILTSMSQFLGGLEKFSASYDTDFDIIMPNGQKLKLAASGNMLVNRPGQFAITRTGTVADVIFNLDNGILTVHGLKLDGYVQFSAKTIDEAITRVREDVGFSAPGADMISAKPFDMDLTDIVSGRHIGMTTIGGETVHHLAFRGNQLDWQLWVKDGDEPFPLKYVITSKLQAGAPEYSLRLTDWNSNPDISEKSFTFTPSATAKKLTGIAIDETGTIISTWE